MVSPSVDVIVMAPFIPALKWSCTLQRNSHRPGTSAHQQSLILSAQRFSQSSSAPFSDVCSGDLRAPGLLPTCTLFCPHSQIPIKKQPIQA